MKRMDDNALRKRVEALLGRLQFRDDLCSRDDLRDLIAMEADGLCLAARLASVNDFPRARKIGSKAARRELDMLARLAASLALLWQIYSRRCFPPICLLQYGHR